MSEEHFGEIIPRVPPELGDDALRRELRETQQMFAALVFANGGKLAISREAVLHAPKLILSARDTVDGTVFTASLEQNNPQRDVREAAEYVGRWFAERNIRRWALGPCQSRHE